MSVSAQRDTQRTAIARELAELQDTPDAEREEMPALLQEFGISASTASQAAREIGDNDPLAAHLQLEYGLDSDRLNNPWLAAGTASTSFLCGAALPMMAAFLAPHGAEVVVLVLVTLATLVMTGALSAALAGNPVVRSAARLLTGGALGLTVTYGIGTLIGGGGPV